MCVCVGMHFSCVHVLLAGRQEGLGTSLDKQTLRLPHLFNSSSHNYTCSPRNRSDNRCTVPQKQNDHTVKTTQWTICLFTSRLSWCRFAKLFVYPCWSSSVVGQALRVLVSIFGFSVMIEKGFINAQFDSYRQTMQAMWYLCNTWYGPLKPTLSWCGREWNLKHWFLCT